MAGGGASEGRNKLAQLEVDIYVTRFLMWARDNPSKKWPESLAALGEYTSDKDTKDPWGNELVMVCGKNAPAEAKGFGVISHGKDGKADTSDDIRSWEAGR